MSYQVLARKYRPASFKELEGQEHVLQALVNALDNERLHHAYLFTGTRGVGKTTIARILARCLNCETGVTSAPCGRCATCLEISEGRSVDLIEVDAASRTGVDDMRGLLDNVQYMPTTSRFKIYLIDEVHMLSRSSFNAMLKTLEEPPEHVKFLFATTDLKKLPITVLSRCLQFNLKNLSPEQIVQYLGKVLDQENIESDEAALWQLGHAADGSMRDALSLTDQAISFSNGEVRDEPVSAMLGSIDQKSVYELLGAISTGDGKGLLETISRISEFAPDYAGLLDEILSVLHRVAIAHAVPEAIDNSQGDKALIVAAAGEISEEQVQLLYQIGLIGQRDLPLAPMPRIGFEMVLLRMMSFVPGSIESAAPGGGQTPGQSEPVSSGSTGAPTGASASRTSGRLGALLSAINGDDTGETVKGSAIAESTTETEKNQAENLGSAAVQTSDPEPVTATIANDKTANEIETAAETIGTEAVSTDEEPRAVTPEPRAIPSEPQTVTPEPQTVTPQPLAITSEPQASTNEPQAFDPSRRAAGAAVPELAPENWSALLDSLNLSGVTRTLAANCLLHQVENGRCVLKLAEHHASLWNASHEERIADGLSGLYGQDIVVAIEVGETEIETPAQQDERERDERQAEAVQEIENDEHVQQLIKSFNARIDTDSISPLQAGEQQ